MMTSNINTMLNKSKKHFIALTVLGLSISPILDAQANTEIPAIDYDAIQGDFGDDLLFIDTGSDTSLLSISEWYQIQAYATAAVSLPRTEASLRVLTKLPDQADFSYQYQNLLTEFQSIYNSGHEWNSSLYPEIVDLALKLANYADIHPQLIVPLMDQLTQLQQNALMMNLPAAAVNRDAAISFLNVLINFTKDQQQSTSDAVENLKQFSAEVETQKAQLDGIEASFGDLLNQSTISDFREKVRLLNEEIAGERSHLDETKRNIGLCSIGGPLVLLICGSIEGAQKERIEKRIADLNEEINSAQQDLEHAINLSASYEIAHTNIDDMITHINNALPKFKKVQQHWQELESDFDSLITALNSLDSDDALRNANLLVAGIVSSPIAATVGPKWSDISTKARTFAQNAYVIVE
ncbi:alpha-xenorhabdolysin family binary toxin subunit A [Photobacterium makurazakiensis]|uniref:alpha-xenorhabdolysin family binary toxin subunit A n=1 Tax=Photobacterium makurazakiensis TaxID=2910234 RepID=UPI003D0C293E